MSRVSYRSILGEGRAGARAEFAPLRDTAIGTRRRDARARLRVRVSEDQRRWLAEVADLTGEGVADEDIVRALIDVGRELPLDWATIARGRELRAAVRTAVGVRRPAGGG